MHSIQDVKHNRRAPKEESFRPTKTMVAKVFHKKSLMHLAMLLFVFSNLIAIASANKNDRVQEGLAAADAAAVDSASLLLKMGASAKKHQYLRRGHSGTDPKVRTLNLLHRYHCTNVRCGLH